MKSLKASLAEKLTVEEAISKGSRSSLSKALSERSKSGLTIDAEVNQDKQTVLHLCVNAGNLSFVSYALKKGANANILDSNQKTPLHYACDAGNLDIIDELIQHTDVTLKSTNGLTPFHLFVHKPTQFSKPAKYDRLFATFIQKGSDLNGLTIIKETPLHMAVRKGNEKVVSLLVNAKANPNLQNNYGETPLHIAVKSGIAKIVKILLTATSDYTIPSLEGLSPIQLAKNSGKKELVDLFPAAALQKTGIAPMSIQSGPLTATGPLSATAPVIPARPASVNNNKLFTQNSASAVQPSPRPTSSYPANPPYNKAISIPNHLCPPNYQPPQVYPPSYSNPNYTPNTLSYTQNTTNMHPPAIQVPNYAQPLTPNYAQPSTPNYPDNSYNQNYNTPSNPYNSFGIQTPNYPTPAYQNNYVNNNYNTGNYNYNTQSNTQPYPQPQPAYANTPYTPNNQYSTQSFQNNVIPQPSVNYPQNNYTNTQQFAPYPNQTYPTDNYQNTQNFPLNNQYTSSTPYQPQQQPVQSSYQSQPQQPPSQSSYQSLPQQQQQQTPQYTQSTPYQQPQQSQPTPSQPSIQIPQTPIPQTPKEQQAPPTPHTPAPTPTPNNPQNRPPNRPPAPNNPQNRPPNRPPAPKNAPNNAPNNAPAPSGPPPAVLQQPQDPPPAPPRLENYMIGDIIGKGGFGYVYKALDTMTGAFVAIKKLQVPKEELEATLAEMNLLKKLDHQHIVRYKGFIKQKDCCYIVMDLIEGGSITQLLSKFGVLPETIISRYVAQILIGLDYIHKKGIIHRDIKCGNILMTKDGVVKLADFGIAISINNKKLDNDDNLQTLDLNVFKNQISGKDNPMGSPYWMSPEVVMEGASSNSDIWSLGATIIEMVTGNPPHYHLNPNQALYRVISGDPPPIPDTVSPQLKDFLELCFRRKASDRPAARELLLHPFIAQFLPTSQVVQAQQEKPKSNISVDPLDELRRMADQNNEVSYLDFPTMTNISVDLLNAQLSSSSLSSSSLDNIYIEDEEEENYSEDEEGDQRSEDIDPFTKDVRKLNEMTGWLASAMEKGDGKRACKVRTTLRSEVKVLRQKYRDNQEARELAQKIRHAMKKCEEDFSDFLNIHESDSDYDEGDSFFLHSEGEDEEDFYEEDY